MNRREVVKVGVGGAVAMGGWPGVRGGEQVAPAAGEGPSFDAAFLQILEGFVRNAEANTLTRMQAVRYYVSFQLLKSAESVLG